MHSSQNQFRQSPRRILDLLFRIEASPSNIHSAITRPVVVELCPSGNLLAIARQCCRRLFNYVRQRGRLAKYVKTSCGRVEWGFDELPVLLWEGCCGWIK